ncbi:MAG: molybdate ABC transporter substrate-binding protein [Myxococcota bacterium]
MKAILAAIFATLLFSFGSAARAGEVQVAVASNFSGPMQVLGDEFFKASGHRATIVSGATGKLYAQIKNGAPFDAMLSADDRAPRQLENDGLAVPGSRFTYALGKLVLYSAKQNLVDDQGAVLRSKSFEHLAIANPKVAPYGSAAIAVLTRLGLLAAIRPKLVEGENIAQTLQFVASGNAELGFVAWSQLLVEGKPRAGSFWLVPESLYPAIRQDAVLLKRGENKVAAKQLIEFLKSETARQIIARSGYSLAPVPSAQRKAAP